MTHEELVRLLWKAEQEAGMRLESSLSDLSQVVDQVVEQLKSGGRLLYVGAGTSGRLAAIDTVEIACTFGFPRERVLTFIAGGVADASIEIESDLKKMLAQFLRCWLLRWTKMMLWSALASVDPLITCSPLWLSLKR